MPDLPPSPAPLPPADGGTPRRLGDLLRAACEPAPLAAPARSADDLVEQAQALERLAAGEGLLEGAEEGAVTLPADLDLLADLAVTQAAVEGGQAPGVSPSVRLAARSAWVAAEQAIAGARGSSGNAPASASRLAPGTAAQDRTTGRGSGAPAEPAAAARSGARAGRARGLRAWGLPSLALLALGLVALGGAAAWLRGALDARQAGAPDALDPATQQALAAQYAVEVPGSLAAHVVRAAGQAAGGAAQSAPFVEARLWRALEGRARRGGAGVELLQRRAPAAPDAPAPDAPAPDAPAPDAPALAAVQPDVVLAWRPDAGGAEATRLRVHVRGPAGLVVALPDLGVEAVLDRAAPDAAPADAALANAALASYVDLPLPEGWAGRLARGELRLAFTLPTTLDAAAVSPAAPSAGAASPAAVTRFDGVSLPLARGAEGS